jgi:hypothetical protein
MSAGGHIRWKRHGLDARRASRGKEGVHLMLANPRWRQLRVRAEMIPRDQRHDYELRGYSHTLSAFRSSIPSSEQRLMFKTERFRGWVFEHVSM